MSAHVHRDENVLKALLGRVGDKKVQVVMSDMAPNMSGTPAVDIPRAMYLVELALDMCRSVLAPGGSFIVKVFQGDGFDEYLREVRSLFTKVKIRKPDASRARSREVYIVDAIVRETGAYNVQIIGKILVLYRPSEARKIILPK